ncbi:MAG: hypothetical protein IJT31_09835, partial [Oscillibacter sp.]|nr:hypothetical protein [Oscillibacter sp.]
LDTVSSFVLPKEEMVSNFRRRKTPDGGLLVTCRCKASFFTLFSTAALTLQCVGYSPTRPFLMLKYLHGAWDSEKRTTYQLPP